MIRVLNSENDPDALLESILDMALRTVEAERGLVLLREDREGPEAGTFVVHASRDLDAETARDAESYSLGIVSQAGQGRSIVALDAGRDERFRDLRSVSLYGIRSLMCVPLRARGRILGTVYLDSRRGGRAFTPEDLRFVEAFADHAGLAVENARMRQRLEWHNRQLQAAAEAATGHGSLVGRSPAMRAVFSLVEKIAASELPVLIRGESGTGKDLVARAIHFQGPRRRRPFLSENCAAIPESLLESELFGHVRGAFTGADRAREGLFERADGGTLFLDEVGDMPPPMQAKLLRVLEDGLVRPVGGEKAIPVNVRVVTATHRDLGGEIRAGRFRQDLLYRLQVLTIELPPLLDRPGDVALLVASFLERIARERGRKATPIDDAALAILERHSWPGNVRELQNVLQRLDLLAGNRAITAELVASDPSIGGRGEAPSRRAGFSLRAGEKAELERALRAADGNRVKAARLLGISRATLYRKLERHGL
jgi:Nif-specific regulatory protein